MNVSKMRPPLGGFEGRLEAELVKAVTARAALPQQPRRRAAMRRPAVRAGVLAAGTAAAATGLALGVPRASRRGRPRGNSAPGARSVHIRTAAFTVDSYTDGTVHVTWDKSQYFEDHAGPAASPREAGFPVLIEEGLLLQGTPGRRIP